MTKLLAFLLRSSRNSFLLAVFFGIAAGVGGVCLLALIRAALREDGLARGTLCLAFVVLCLATVAARVLAQLSMVRLAQGSVAELVRHLCERILALPLRTMEDHEAGRLTAVLTEDVVVLTNALSGIPSLFINVTVFFGCFVYLGVISPTLLACTAAFAGPAIVSHEYLIGRGRRRMAKARLEQEGLVGHFRAMVEGFKDLKLHRERREAFLAESISAATARVQTENVAGLSLFAFVSGWGQLLFLGYLGFIVFGLPAIVELPRDDIAAAALTVVYAMSPLDSLLNWLPILMRAGASMRRIEELGLDLANGPAVETGLNPSDDPGVLRNSLVLRDITYVYAPGEDGGEGFSLGPVNLTVRRGELLFLVGGNGSGKTTLVKLLTGLYAPASGMITYDGNVLSGNSIEEFQRLFTVVFADGFLFPSLLGLDAPDLDERAEVLLDELGLEGLVTVNGGEFSTTRLSQGQQKRLALLVACLEERPVLVLDEWASYQDPRFKRAFYRDILPGLKAMGKTLIVISHDEEYFALADRVVHLSAGMLVRGEETLNPNRPFPVEPEDLTASEPLSPTVASS